MKFVVKCARRRFNPTIVRSSIAQIHLHRIRFISAVAMQSEAEAAEPGTQHHPIFQRPSARSQPIPKLLVLAISDVRKLDVFQMPNAENPLLLRRRQFVPSLVLPHVVGSQRES